MKRYRIALLIILLLMSGCAAEKAYNKGKELSAKGDMDEAVLFYQKALTLDPGNLAYRLELDNTRSKAALKHFASGEKFLKEKKYDAADIEFQIALLMDPTFRRAEYSSLQAKKLKESDEFLKKGKEFLAAKKTVDAKNAFKKALNLDPDNLAAKEALDGIKEGKTKLDGYELSLKSTKPITLKFKDTNIKEVFEIISKLSGINFIFDEDVKDQKVSIFLQDATFEQAMELLLLTNKLFTKVVTENTVIIIPKTPAKVKQYQDLVIQTFYLSHLEAKKAVNLLRALLQLKQVHVNDELNALIVRDEPDRIKLAQKVIEANDIPDAEVMLEVEIIEVNRDKLSELGLNLSTTSLSAGIYSADAIKSGDTGFATSMTFDQLKHLTGDKNLLFSPLPQAVFNFKKQQGGAKTLANPKIRVLNNGKAKIHIGDRIPIITTTAQVNIGTQTSVQYQDVGVKLNVEPRIHTSNDVTIKVSLEVSSIGAPVVDPTTKLPLAYQIGSRSAETSLNLKDGETQVMGGLIRDDERNTKVVIPLIGEIPIIGRLFSTNSDQKTKSDLLLAITPHVMRGLEVPSDDITTIWSGKEDDFTSRVPFESFKDKVEAGDEQAPPAGPGGVVPPVPGGQTGKFPPSRPGSSRLPNETISETTAPPVSSSGGSVSIVAPPNVKIAQEFTIGVSVGEVANLYGASVGVSFNPEVVEFVRISEGALLKQDGKPSTFMHAVNSAEGKLTVGMTRLGPVGGINGSGQLFQATFRAKTEGNAGFNLSEMSLKDPSLATMPASAVGAEVKVLK